MQAPRELRLKDDNFFSLSRFWRNCLWSTKNLRSFKVRIWLASVRLWSSHKIINSEKRAFLKKGKEKQCATDLYHMNNDQLLTILLWGIKQTTLKISILNDQTLSIWFKCVSRTRKHTPGCKSKWLSFQVTFFDKTSQTNGGKEILVLQNEQRWFL